MSIVKTQLEKSEESLSDFLQKKCMEVRLSISWFPTSRVVDRKNSKLMSNTVNAKEKAISHGKRLFASKHDAIKQANAAKSALENYVRSMTIPIMKLPTDSVQGTDSEKAQTLLRDPGARLILLEDIEKFDANVQTLAQVMYTAVAAIDKDLEAIKAAERDRLGDVYDERDYPEEVRKLVQVRGPHYSQVGYSIDFAKVCPQVFSRVEKQLKAQLEGTVSAAAEDIGKTLYETVQHIANSLGNRVRLFPSREDLRRFRSAEVVDYADHACAPHLVSEPNHVRVTAKTADGDLIEIGPLPLSVYEADYHPLETTERRRFHKSVIDNLQEQLESFQTVSAMLGDHGKSIAESVTALNGLLASGGARSAQIVEELKTSRSYRSQAIAKLRELSSSLGKTIVTTQTADTRQKRRVERIDA